PVPVRGRSREPAPFRSGKEFHPRYLLRKPRGPRGVACDCDRTAPHRILRKLRPVELFTVEGEENGARRRLAAVVNDGFDFDIRRPRNMADLGARQKILEFHAALSQFRAPPVISQLGLLFETGAQFPPLRTDTGSSSPGRPNRTVTRLPRITWVPASGNCSTATPVPLSEGASPSFKHASVTPRTLC